MGSYTLGNSERELFGETVPFHFDRRHALTVAINVVLASKVRASVRSQYASGFPVTPLHEEVVFNERRQRLSGGHRPGRDSGPRGAPTAAS